MNTAKKLLHWRVVGASVRGTSHQKVKQLCQDAHHWEMLSEDILVAAVADGAGSATLGKVGAIVAVQTAIETICAKKELLRSLDNDQDWQILLTDALLAAKTAVEAEAVACKTTAREFASTLLLAIATPKIIAAAQVGDGVVVASDRHGNMVALTAPQRGEYINETIFLVSPQAMDTAQVSVWRGAIANIAVLSDGLQMLALEMNETTPYTPFFSPLFKFVAEATNQIEAKEQLVNFLRSERITNRTDDDLTLLLATIVN